MTLQLALIALIASAGLYGIIAYWKSQEITSIRKFFHIDKVRDGAFSIVAGNLTLGTGLFYVASLAQKQALFALLMPLGVFLGYRILSRVVANLNIELEGGNHNILDSIRTREKGGKIFYKFISAVIVLTYLVIIPFEIYVSSSLFASVLPAPQTGDVSIVFAVVIFSIVVIYSAIGGLRGIVATDIIQLLFISLMLIIIFVGAFNIDTDQQGGKAIGLWPSGNLLAVLSLAVASFVTAVATQMYNIINLTVSTSFNSEKQQKLFGMAGKILPVALVLFVLTGLVTSGLGTSNLAGIDLLLGKLPVNNEAYLVVVLLVVFGMVAVLISTADSGIMAISQMIYENVWNGDSHSEDGGIKLWFVRIVFVILPNAVAVIFLVLLFKHETSLISYLLASISALTVAAPFIVSSALNMARHGYCLIIDRRISISIIILVTLVWIISIWRVFSKGGETNDDIGNYLILGGVILGLIYFLIDRSISTAKNRKPPLRQACSIPDRHAETPR